MSGTTSNYTTTAADLFSGLCAVAEAIRAAATDPAVQIRLLIELADYYPESDPTYTAAMCRRAALISLCRASSNYQPSSYQDALSMRSTIVGLLNTEAIACADAGQSTSYLAFNALATQVANDLTTKAGTLASVITINLPKSFPALSVAYRLYGDATRSDDLIARANPPNPSFMPATFEALAS
jgi:prophage DNA circulation protein